MSISASLLAFGVRYVFDATVVDIFHVVKDQMTDHGQALPKALAEANDRAWQAVGLALAGDGLFERFKDLFRDGDLKGVRDQIKKFLDNTPTGLETASAPIREKAAKEWHRLRQSNRLSATSIPPAMVARQAATLERYSSPAQLTSAAHRAVEETAIALREEGPNLAKLLTIAPANGTPLLASAFAFFFRRKVETNSELAHGLTFDYLRQLSERQERGFKELEASLGEQLGGRLDSLFDALGDWFAGTDAKLEDINGKLDQLIKRRDVPTSTSEPLKVTVTNKAELELLQSLRDRLRALPPEMVAAADWSKLGDTLAAAGQFQEADEAQAAAAAAAKAAGDRAAEAQAEYKRFRAACETGDSITAMTAFRRAIELDHDRFTPFDLHRYRPEAILGSGGFGTVFLADDLYIQDGKERKPLRVAIKAMHDSGWDTILERNLSETFDEANTLSALNHPGIVKTLNRDFGDPARRKRPYVVLEYFEGITLDAWLKDKTLLPVRDRDVLRIARQIAEAVHQAHQLGIYHRDIKPANVMVRFDKTTGQWLVKVIDFGLAVKLHVAQTSLGVPSGRRAALDRSLAGTLRYAPPEQRNELDADIGPYSDVYAWGKTCLDLLFKTTEPKSFHWEEIPEPDRKRLQHLLERATVDDLKHRLPNFEPVLMGLAELLDELRRAQPVSTPSALPLLPERERTKLLPTDEVPSGKVIEDEKSQLLVLEKPTLDNLKPGEEITVTIPIPNRGVKPGTICSLKWKPVPRV